MPVIPFPSERVFNPAPFMCRHIVFTTMIFLFHLEEYSILQLLCAGTIPPLEISHICIWKIVVAKICRNHACYSLCCAHSRDRKWHPRSWMATLNNVSALSTALVRPPALTPPLSITLLHESFHLVFCLPLCVFPDTVASNTLPPLPFRNDWSNWFVFECPEIFVPNRWTLKPSLRKHKRE